MVISAVFFSRFGGGATHCYKGDLFSAPKYYFRFISIVGSTLFLVSNKIPTSLPLTDFDIVNQMIAVLYELCDSLEEGVDDHDDKTLENQSESADDDQQGFQSFDNDTTTTTTGVFV